MNKIIYRKDTKDRCRILEISTFQDKLIQKSGLLEGKLTERITQCYPKNLGKSNGTSAEEQAIIEAEAIITKKLKEGYYLTQAEAMKSINLMPMLATTADINKLEYPVMVQPKLDGIRCIATNKIKLSRKNRPFTNLDHIDLSDLPDDMILDGEMYCHKLSFQENTKLIKKYRKGKTEQIQYHIYDMPSFKGNFFHRITDILLKLGDTLDNIVIVPTYMVNTKEELLDYHTEFLKDGYEGTIIRTLDTEYEFNKRSKSLIKFKDFIDEEFLIIDVIPTEKIPEHGTVICKTSEGKIFKCGNKLSHKDREELLTNKDNYIGKLATVTYFEKTDGNIPRFPVFKAVRELD